MSRASSPARLVQLDLAVAILLTVAALLATLGSVPLILTLPLVVALVLFLPGYALLCTLIMSAGLSSLERALIAVAGSIGVTILAGLAMAALGLSLDRANWVAALATISLAGLVFAWVRRWVHRVPGPRLVVPGMPLRQAVIALIAVLLLANAVLASRLVGSDQLGPPPAQLWLVEGADPTTAQLGVRAGPDGGSYRVRVSSAGTSLHEFDVPLDSSEVWQTTLLFTIEQRQLPVVARLYEGDSDIETRYVVLQALPSPVPSAAPQGAGPPNGG